MTEGSISRKIILFAIPLFLGNLFQQLYNMELPWEPELLLPDITGQK